MLLKDFVRKVILDVVEGSTIEGEHGALSLPDEINFDLCVEYNDEKELFVSCPYNPDVYKINIKVRL